MRPAGFGLDHAGADAALVFGDEQAGQGAERAAFADLPEQRGRQPIAGACIAVAIFGPAGPAPVGVAIGGTGGDREEILGQRRVIAEKSARCDRLLVIDDIAAIKSPQRFIAIQREIDGPLVADRDALGQAVGGKGARPIFGDFLLVHAADDARTVPGADIDADPGGAGIDIFAVGNFIGTYDPDILGHRIASGDAVPGRKVDTFVLAAQGKFGLCIQLQLAVKQPLGCAEADEGGFIDRAIGQPVVGIDHPRAEGCSVGAIFQFGRAGAAARVGREEIFLVAGDC